jgi:hypothetical protein
MSAITWERDGLGFAEVVVPQPMSVAFDYVSDLRHMPVWWPTHRSYRRLAGSGDHGTWYAWVMPRSPLRLPVPTGGLSVVTAFERPTRFSYRIFAPGLLSRMHYGFAGVPGGTRVSLEVRPARQGFQEPVAAALDRLAATLTPAAPLYLASAHGRRSS